MNARTVLLRSTAAVAAFVALTAAVVTPDNAAYVHKKDGQKIYSVTLPEGWQFDRNVNAFNSSADSLKVTRLGDALQAIWVFRRKHSDAFSEIKVATKPDTGVEELSEFFVAGLKKVNKNVEILATVPETVSGLDAARVDWRMVTETGVPYRASTYLFVTTSSIYEVQYKATEQIYYDLDRPKFDAFVASFALAPEKAKKK